MLHWRGSSERLRLQGQPLSWLLARSGLSCRPPYPQAVLVPRNLLAGVAAPLLFCAPACASARRFPLWCAKAHLVSPPHRCHLSPQWPYWCLPLRGRRRKRHARRRFGLKPCADSCRAGRPRWRGRGARDRGSRSVFSRCAVFSFSVLSFRAPIGRRRFSPNSVFPTRRPCHRHPRPPPRIIVGLTHKKIRNPSLRPNCGLPINYSYIGSGSTPCVS